MLSEYFKTRKHKSWENPEKFVQRKFIMYLVMTKNEGGCLYKTEN